MAKRWALLTSNEIRHRYVANHLSFNSNVLVVLSEPKSRQPKDRFATEEERRVLDRYFNARENSEKSILSEGLSWNFKHGQTLIEVPSGAINSIDYIEALKAKQIDYCFVFGTSWLKEPWLSAFQGRMFNLHLGLSPYYRGSGTNFWALKEGHPEFVGATIHKIDAGIDSGDILFHVRPDPLAEDDVHAFFNRVIQKSTAAVFDWLDFLPEWEAVPQSEMDSGKEYKGKDFSASHVLKLDQLVGQGLIRKYFQERGRRPEKLRLVREYNPK